jgi:hypothetical protein
MLSLVNCGNYNLDNACVSKVECPAPKRQIDCPSGLLFSNGKCANDTHNWVSSDPYLKNGRLIVTYTQLSKPTPKPNLDKIPSPKTPPSCKNIKSVEEYIKQIEEERNLKD